MASLPVDHIAVTNVRPAYAASIARGATQAELEALGLPQACMADDDASVSGEATYQHMAWMQARGAFGHFLVDAARRHTGDSLGVLGLACKTVPTVAAALACHARFQHLTNRTARYEHRLDDARLLLTEHRHGPPTPGCLLVSDYTMLVAVHLLQVVSGSPVPVVEIASRRARIPEAEREVLEDFFGCTIGTGVPHARLVLPAEVLGREIPRADPELAAYFQQVLARAARFGTQDSELVTRCRLAIQESMARGTPSGAEIGRRLGMSQRTLQRHLQTEGIRLTELIADTRARLAKGYLADPRLSVAETAFLLGYRKDTSFFRAFKRWTGMTPSQWRADLDTGS